MDKSGLEKRIEILELVDGILQAWNVWSFGDEHELNQNNTPQRVWNKSTKPSLKQPSHGAEAICKGTEQSHWIELSIKQPTKHTP
jgi:hypothetical protein